MRFAQTVTNENPCAIIKTVNRGKTSTFRSFVFSGFDYGTSQLLHTSAI